MLPSVTESESVLRELHSLAKHARVPSLCEAIRLLESDKFDALTGSQIREVGNYGAVEIGDEWFFRRAFSPGKEAAASLAFAQRIGRDRVLEDLRRLRGSLGLSVEAA